MGLISSSDDGQGVMLISVSSIFLALAVVAVAMRIWSSHLKKRYLNRNDYLILLALVWNSGCLISFCPITVVQAISAALVAIIVTGRFYFLTTRYKSPC